MAVDGSTRVRFGIGARSPGPLAGGVPPTPRAPPGLTVCWSRSRPTAAAITALHSPRSAAWAFTGNRGSRRLPRRDRRPQPATCRPAPRNHGGGAPPRGSRRRPDRSQVQDPGSPPGWRDGRHRLAQEARPVAPSPPCPACRRPPWERRNPAQPGPPRAARCRRPGRGGTPQTQSRPTRDRSARPPSVPPRRGPGGTRDRVPRSRC